MLTVLPGNWGSNGGRSRDNKQSDGLHFGALGFVGVCWGLWVDEREWAQGILELG